MTKPTNTAKTDPYLLLAALMFGGSSTPIEDMEAAGQRELVNSTSLPVDGIERDVLEQMGFVVGDIYSEDPIFREVQLPPGWSKQPTDHSMWSKVVDEQGRERIAVFYKAAFYDRSAHCRTVRRFNIRVYEDVPSVTDGNEVIFSVPRTVTDLYSDAYYAESEKIRDTMEAWLVERYPDWRNPLAYW